MNLQTLIPSAIFVGCALVYRLHWRRVKQYRQRNDLYLCAHCGTDLRSLGTAPETLIRAQTVQEQHWFCQPCAARLRRQERWFLGVSAAVVVVALAAIGYFSLMP